MAILMDGKALAKEVKSEVLAHAQQLRAKGIVPKLAVILAGDDPASAVYVRNKIKDCEECGIEGVMVKLPADTSQDELMVQIARLNADESVHGILLQHPYPKGIDEFTVRCAIDPVKDVDSLHPENAGLITHDRPNFLPGTPAGIMALLDHYKIELKGKHCVIINRTHIVGKPMAQLMLQRDATITVCHSRTPDLTIFTRTADILITAVGKLGLITGEMVKPGVVVIDVGICKKPDGKLAGDADIASVEPLASYITPVPGGVGPMTRAILMKNTITAAVEETV
ncbi:MAG: bifunctional 5,10-methylenetetrahydrofolate dehydrogenase/5,10-methenyltetrahydrofolate cyclohydrolase [Oscillospiraceae bacterium]|nr:bifunctional 5,10-methylenetetrahydrofolate dehydrogenase/5,10-methenyltetrahydrofolate cyclohydrolase [Oscillospiraceae bacterium]